MSIGSVLFTSFVVLVQGVDGPTRVVERVHTLLGKPVPDLDVRPRLPRTLGGRLPASLKAQDVALSLLGRVALPAAGLVNPSHGLEI